jgi:hypothetical protein
VLEIEGCPKTYGFISYKDRLIIPFIDGKV